MGWVYRLILLYFEFVVVDGDVFMVLTYLRLLIYGSYLMVDGLLVLATYVRV